MAMNELYEGIETNTGGDDRPNPAKSKSDETLLLKRLRGGRHYGKGRWQTGNDRRTKGGIYVRDAHDTYVLVPASCCAEKKM